MPPELPTMPGKMMWDWARAYASAGYTATAARAEIQTLWRVPEKLWYATFKEAFAVEGYRESIKRVPMTYVIPEALFAVPPVPKDWTQEWNLIVDVRWYDLLEGTWRHTTVQVESDVLLTKREWFDAIEVALSYNSQHERYDAERGFSVEEYEALRRVYP